MADKTLKYDIVARDNASRVFASVGASAGKLHAQIGVVGRGISTALGVVAGAGLVDLAKTAVATGIKTAAGLQQAQVAFATLMGSGQKAQAFLAQLKSFAAATPFELPGLIDASRLLLGVGESSKQTMTILQDFGDAAGAVGIGQENFQRVMLATSQVISSGKIKLGDMNQLMNDGLPIWKLLSEALHKPVPAIQDMISHGQLLSKDVLPKLEAQMHHDYGGAMARQSQTLNGVWSTLVDTFRIGMGSVIQPLIPILSKDVPAAANVTSKALQAGSTAFSGFIAGLGGGGSGRFAKIGEEIRGGLAKVAPTLKQVGGDLRTFIGQAATSVKNLAVALGPTAVVLAGVFLGALRAVGSVLAHQIGPALVAVTGWMKNHQAVVGTVVGAYVGYIAVTKAIVVATAGWSAVMKGVTAVQKAYTLAVTVARFPLLTFIGVKALEVGAWLRSAAGAVASTAALVANKVVYGGSWLATFVAVKGLEIGAWVRSAAGAVASTVALVAYRGAVIAASIASKVWAAAQWLLNVALDANPIGLVIIAIAALVAGFIYAWKHSQTFRDIVIGVWHAIVAGAKWLGDRFVDLWHLIVHAWDAIVAGIRIAAKFIADIWFGIVGDILNGAARAFGWVPGLGPKLKAAAKAFAAFRDEVNAALGGVHNRALDVTAKGYVLPSSGYAIIGGSRIAMEMHAQGGPITGGVPGRDSVPSLLMPGEYVVRSDGSNLGAALAHYGAMGMAAGGVVPRASTSLGRLAGFGGRMQDTVGNAFGRAVAIAMALSQAAVDAPGVGDAVTRWAPVILSVLRALGQSPGLLGAVERRIRFESGGNPNAINLSDSNALAGHPSQGLVQTIPSTFYAYAGPYAGRGITDPFANIYAGMRYAISRYGSISAIDPLNMPTGYASGTDYVPRTGMYMLHQGEAVIPARANRTGDTHITINMPPGSDGADVVRALQDYARRNGPIKLATR